MFRLSSLLLLLVSSQLMAQDFRVIVLAEHGGIHKPFVDAAKHWLDAEAQRDGFAIDYLEDTTKIDDSYLAQHRLFIQLNYPPYGWTPVAAKAFEHYIESGQGGWIGFHHATLLGEFDGYPIWPWFQQFMGGIRWKDYIRTFASATVKVEAPEHPVMQGLPPTFEVNEEEWYTYDRSPRPEVHVLASVDESSYHPDSPIKMGDHPVVWTNEHYKARNVYIFIGHRPEHFQNPNFVKLFHNAILWASASQGSAQPRVLALYSTGVESDHVEFAEQALQFYSELGTKNNFTLVPSTDWDKLASEELSEYKAVLWLDDSPHTDAQRKGFENYMKHGGAWIGFHAAGYNDKDTHWPWFVDFLGGAVFYSNNWPPLPAQLTIETADSGLPSHFEAPANEWYIWKPSPRADSRVKVLLTLDPGNYPLGFKDVLLRGDLPVAWSNTDYRMIYINMGHGDKIFTSSVQNVFLRNALLSILGERNPK